jgi:hypothetical protein
MLNGATIFEHRVGSFTAMTTENVNEVKVTEFELHILRRVLKKCHPFLVWEVAGNLLRKPNRAGSRHSPQGTSHLSLNWLCAFCIFILVSVI